MVASAKSFLHCHKLSCSIYARRLFHLWRNPRAVKMMSNYKVNKTKKAIRGCMKHYKHDLLT